MKEQRAYFLVFTLVLAAIAIAKLLGIRFSSEHVFFGSIAFNILIAAAAITPLAFWIHRRRCESNAFTLARNESRLGNHADAVRWFLVAESKWTLNWAHNTPKTSIVALERLREIINCLRNELLQQGKEVDITQTVGVIDELLGVFQDRKNRGWGSFGTSQSINALGRASTLYESLDMKRRMLRSTLSS